MDYPRLNIIYDSRRFEKYEPLMKELETQGITNYEIWPCILDKTTVVGISKSFKMIVQNAKDIGLPEVAIAEDDLHFPAKDGWKKFLENKPDDFDVYCGGTYWIHNPNEFKPPIIKVEEWVGNHLIIISRKYYDQFLSTPDHLHIDTAQSGLGDFYVCFPFVALQRPGFSSNAMIPVNYNTMLRSEWIHK